MEKSAGRWVKASEQLPSNLKQYQYVKINDGSIEFKGLARRVQNDSWYDLVSDRFYLDRMIEWLDESLSNQGEGAGIQKPVLAGAANNGEGKERCQFEKIVESYYGLDESVPVDQKIYTTYSDLVSLVAYAFPTSGSGGMGEGWISVNDQLPETGKMVITYHESSDCMCDNWIYEGRWVEKINGRNDDITHWRRFPSPPKHKE